MLSPVTVFKENSSTVSLSAKLDLVETDIKTPFATSSAPEANVSKITTVVHHPINRPEKPVDELFQGIRCYNGAFHQVVVKLQQEFSKPSNRFKDSMESTIDPKIVRDLEMTYEMIHLAWNWSQPFRKTSPMFPEITIEKAIESLKTFLGEISSFCEQKAPLLYYGLFGNPIGQPVDVTTLLGIIRRSCTKPLPVISIKISRSDARGMIALLDELECLEAKGQAESGSGLENGKQC